MPKVKLEDIAKEVGCSVATVSYVINNNPKQKINPESRKRILQVASVLGYQKNSVASALSSGKYNLIGIYLGKPSFALETNEKFIVVDKIVSALALNGFQVVLLPSSYSKEVHCVDAIVCIGLSDEDFKIVSSNNFIPVIGYDTRVHEPWIFEISCSYKGIADKFLLDDYVFITYDIESESIKEEIKRNNKEVVFVSSFMQLDNIKNKFNDRNIVVAGNEIINYLKDKNLKLTSVFLDIDKKVNRLVSCIKIAINHSMVETHKFVID